MLIRRREREREQRRSKNKLCTLANFAHRTGLMVTNCNNQLRQQANPTSYVCGSTAVQKQADQVVKRTV